MRMKVQRILQVVFWICCINQGSRAFLFAHRHHVRKGITLREPSRWHAAAAAATAVHDNNPWKVHDKEILHRKFDVKYVPEEDVDYLIIGSGIGGLWLAACLAKFNRTSIVLEQHDIAGGFQHVFRRGPYEFVPGLHYIANLPLCAPLYDMVATTTTPLLQYHQAGHAVAADQGASHDLQVASLPPLQVKEGLENVREELHRAFPNEHDAIDQFLTLMEQAKWQAGQFATFKIFPPWLAWILSQLVCSSYMKYASLTTAQVLEPLTSDGRLTTVLSAFGGDLGESLADGSFVMQAAVLGHVLEGCHYPQGGPIQFVRGLVPTIRSAGGDVLVSARVQRILIEQQQQHESPSWFGKREEYRAVGVELANGQQIRCRHGVVSDAGIRSTLKNLLPTSLIEGPLRSLYKAVEECSGGISHVFCFVGLNASTDDLKLRSSSFYYIPWNESTSSMDATVIQDFYRDTLLDPNVLNVSAGMVFCSAKDPIYSNRTMPGRSTAVIFSEARAQDFEQFVVKDKSGRAALRTKEYKQAKQLIQDKMMRSLYINFPHLPPHVDWIEVGTPLTLMDYTLRTETLGLRHTPRRMTSFDIRPDCAVKDLYFTGQDVSFAGWAGALTGAMVTAQRILGYTLLDFARGKTLMRELGRGDVEDMIQQKVKEATKASPLEVVAEIISNAVRHVTNPMK